MKINAQARMLPVERALERIEKQVGPKGSVDVGAIKQQGLKELAKTLQTGCTSSVSVPRLKQALKQIGTEVTRADKDRDGKLDTEERKRLSPLAARLLNVAAKKPTDDGGSVSTGCSSPAPSRPVSTGCASPAPSRPSTPSRPVSTGCASPAPSRPSTPSRPVSTGCASPSRPSGGGGDRPVGTGC
ncbi:MAG: hypothetical protein HY904_22020 [Deltaproteobacteria bacterium]|nr:hypothetical protein [Deltaproteobacteria bacterium]